MHDVLIVGAGPAGCAAALAARRRGARVLVLDRESFPRDKTCGDGIAPYALGVLRALGVTGLTDGYPAVPSLGLVGPSGDLVARPFRTAVHTIPRTVFDHRLLEAALASGATFQRHQVRRVVTRDGVVEVDDLAARVVIGADGANSTVRRQLGLPANPAGFRALAMRGYAPMAARAPHEHRIVMAAQDWPAYAWSFPIGDGRRNIGYGEVLRARTLSRAHLLDRLSSLLPDVDLELVTDLRAHHLPLSTYRPPAGRGRLLLAGDAMSLINPMTGEGIFYAVLSGALAGAAAATGTADAGDRYARTLYARLGRHLRHTRILASLGTRPWAVDAGIRAANRRQRAFDALVDLGLGEGLLTPRLLGSAAAAWLVRAGRR
jgi:menaquinone-9 beta-reductase